MEIRDLEKTTISLVPELVFMESDTVLVQYIISSWSLQYRNHSEYRVMYLWRNYAFKLNIR